MTRSEPARTTRRIRIRRIGVAGLVVVIEAIAVALGHQSLAPSSSTAAPGDALRGEHRGPLGEPDDVVPAQRRIRDGGDLDPALVGALGQAATAAAYDGVEWYVKSG